MGVMQLILLAALVVSGLARAVTGDFVPNKDVLRKRYAYLYSLPVVSDPGGEKHFHRARLMVRSGIHVLSLRGDAFEMAFQHGRLLANEIRVGAVIGSGKMVERAIDNTYGHRPVFAATAKKFIDKKYGTDFVRNAVRHFPDLSRSVLERIFAVSEAAGLPLNTTIDGAIGPSVMMMLANNQEKDYSAFTPPSACTSFVTWGPYTAGGDMLIARNTDYPLSGYFEPGSTVLYLQPTDGGQKVMAITTAGVHSAAVTGINEAGIYLGTHSLPSKATGTVGTPMILWMHDALATSKTVDEVIAKLTAAPAEVGWTYVVASEKEKRVVSVEVDNAGFGIRESTGGKHIQTNHYLTKELEPRMLYFNQGTREETWNRYERADTLVEAAKGKLDENTALRILSDHQDSHSKAQNGFPSNVAATTTVSSLIYRPSKRYVWIATGMAPVPHNPYVQFPVPADFDENSFSSTKLETMQDTWFQDQTPQKFKALKSFIAAKEAFEYEQDLDTAHDLTQKAADLAPSVGHYRLMQGLVEIRQNKFKSASATLENALKQTLSPHGQALAHYYLARILANSGNRTQALTELDLALRVSPPESQLVGFVQNLAGKLAKTSTHRLRWFDVIPQFQFGDSQAY
jgi:tetratricopeptide (TPR) repeat protein